MRLQITLDLGSRAGATVHQVLVDHPAKTLEEFRQTCSDELFITVEEIHKHGPVGGETLREAGPLMLATRVIGKVKVYQPD